MRTVDTVVAVPVQKFNKGSRAILDVMNELDVLPGNHAAAYSAKADIPGLVKRVTKAEKEATQQERRKRKQ